MTTLTAADLDNLDENCISLAGSITQAEGGIAGQAEMNSVDCGLFSCFSAVFTSSGLKSAALLLALTAAVAVYLKFGKFRDKDYDPRGFTLSRDGTYGTAAWMSE